MHLDAGELRDFYATPLGQVARQLIAEEILSIWPDAKGECLVGLGHTTPYLQPYLDAAERVVALMAAAEGVLPWPAGAQNLTALTFEDKLPLPDNSVDKVLLVHLLESARDPHEVLREVWRVLIPTGRVLVVAPYRSGAWARADHTPFGLGRPYSRYQLCRYLEGALLDPLEMRRFLYVPPSGKGPVIRSARMWERVGRTALPRFAGCVAVEAQKTVTRGLPVAQKAPALRLMVPGFAGPRPALPLVAARRLLSGAGGTPPALRRGSRTTTGH